MPAQQGPSDTCLCPCSHSAAVQVFNPALMRHMHRLLCPLALWIRKVLLCLSDRVSNIDLNSLTCFIPDDCNLSPQPLNPSSWRVLCRNVFTVKLEASPVCPQVLPPVQWNYYSDYYLEEKEGIVEPIIIIIKQQLSGLVVELIRNIWLYLFLVTLNPTCYKQIPVLPGWDSHMMR